MGQMVWGAMNSILKIQNSAEKRKGMGFCLSDDKRVWEARRILPFGPPD